MFSGDGDGFEIIIYIVAMVVGLAYNAYRNYSKRKERELKKTEGESPDFPEVIFEQIEEPELYYPEVEQPMEEVLERSSREIVAETAEEPLEVDRNFNKAVVADTKVDTLPTEQGEAEEDFYFTDSDSISEGEIKNVDQEEANMGEEFDLEKAVIYSEILKPKYFNNSY